VGAHLDFTIAPTWYQTNWFRITCVGALLECANGQYGVTGADALIVG
jgi:hypothetical protein